MIPRFFGDAQHQLFGVYHPPARGAPARRAGAVLCYPGPQEYRQAHWVYRRLATLLTEAGTHVLRFDYSATGDSAGESVTGSLSRWVDDTQMAVEELQDVAGVRRIALVGMRLGAAIAAQACAGGAAGADLVLWDPVVRGTEYLAELDAEHATGLRDRSYPEDDFQGSDEVLGFVLPEGMRAELCRLDLVAAGCGRPDRILIVAAEDAAAYAELRDALCARGLACDLRHTPDATLARGGHWASDTLLARRIPAVIAEFLQRT